eukprot:CAMPEP_0179895208 /NCGR_PEP_ID=MMETSP0982-20121206/35699_1 /TAXON_ID=483367 /ORGANISM="non described non described, Strain CCMP 2436" /LENGTH=78 /DNA_ID=CAMNT_0021791855 /DNA_START=66 /DNA_END=299 /DNA_ORIENTATION=+
MPMAALKAAQHGVRRLPIAPARHASLLAHHAAAVGARARLGGGRATARSLCDKPIPPTGFGSFFGHLRPKKADATADA